MQQPCYPKQFKIVYVEQFTKNCDKKKQYYLKLNININIIEKNTYLHNAKIQLYTLISITLKLYIFKEKNTRPINNTQSQQKGLVPFQCMKYKYKNKQTPT